MILYNITIKIDPSILDEWLTWIKSEHIPQVMDTGCFIRFTMFKLLEVDEADGTTFAIQYFAENKSDYDHYIENHAGTMRHQTIEKWGNKFIAFRSVMEVVN
ncbi:MAG: DUF4286 family protein [Ferruginibacter sp.]